MVFNAILEVMLRIKNISNIRSKWEVGNGKIDNEMGSEKNPTSHFKNPASHLSLLTSFPRKWELTQGFGLIELMIVITVFGIAVSVITASFLSFERNQRLKSAASTLKNDIRLVQSKALSDDKGVVGDPSSCSSGDVLVGWYLKINRAVDDDSYAIARDCNVSGVGEQTFNVKNVFLPRDISIPVNGITCGVFSGDYATILYRPLATSVSFHNNLAPPFLDSSGNLTNTICTGSTLTITLQLDSNPSKTYRVVVIPSGEVSEQQ